MKEAFYFPHDVNATQDPKMMLLMAKCGIAGIGMYWILIEILHQQPTGKITYEAFQNYIEMYSSFDSKSKGTMFRENIEQMLIKCQLLLIDDEQNVYSERVLLNKNNREELSQKRSLAGKKSAESRVKLANAQLVSTHVEQGKEIKGKEKKYINTEPSAESKNRQIGNISIPKPVSTNEWQQLAVDYASKLGFTPNPSWFKLFKDNFDKRGLLLKAFQVTEDRHAQNPEMFFYKVFGGQNAPRTA